MTRVLTLMAVVLAACSSGAATASGDVEACKDIRALTTSLNGISNDLAGSKRLFATMRGQAAALVAHAPAALRADARGLAHAINTVQPIVAKTTSVEQVQRLEQTDSRFQTAMSDLQTYAQNAATWREGHCR